MALSHVRTPGERKWRAICPLTQENPPGFNFSLPKPESSGELGEGCGSSLPQRCTYAHTTFALCVRELRDTDVEDVCHPTFKSPSSFEYADFLLGQFAMCVILVGGQFPVTATSCCLPPWKLTEARFFLCFVEVSEVKHTTQAWLGGRWFPRY